MKIEKHASIIIAIALIFAFNSPIFAQNKVTSESETLAKAWFDEALLETDNVRKIEDYDNALRLNPNIADAYNNRGVAKKHLGRFSEAIADYDQAILLKPDFAVAYFNRGDAKKALGQYENALKDFDKAIELRPNLPQPYGNKGCTLVALGRHKEALIWLNKCLALDENAKFAQNCRQEAKKRMKNEK
jgi:tetratricopeptide (TPR) repeat protein